MVSEYSTLLNLNTIVAFDTDGTLITYDDKPRYDIINLYHMFEKLGCTMVIMSGGGEDYARTWAEKLGLEADKICCKFDLDFKPDIMFDDESVEIGKINIRV